MVDPGTMLLLSIISRALILAPEIIELMDSEKDITLEDLMPTPRAALEAKIRAETGLEEPTS